MEPLIYDQARPTLLTGHLIEWDGDYALSKGIKTIGNIKRSHTSLIIRLNDKGVEDRVFLVEALETGVELTLLSDRLCDYKGKAYVIRFPLTEDQQGLIRGFAMVECAKRKEYDLGGLFANAFGEVTIDGKKWFCSELAHAALIWGLVLPERKKAYRPGAFLKKIPNATERQIIFC
jgi:hypothetical protein